MVSYYKKYYCSLVDRLKMISVRDVKGLEVEVESGFDQLCEISGRLLESSGKQFLVGNGASASFSNHMALDWTKNGGVATFSFSDSAMLTAMGNDLGFEEVFSFPLGLYCTRGDLLVAISSSGNSRNVVRAVEEARMKGLTVVTMTGLKSDNKLRSLGDLNFYIPGYTYGIVECAHQTLLHIWLDKFMDVREWERGDCQNMNKGNFLL